MQKEQKSQPCNRAEPITRQGEQGKCQPGPRTQRVEAEDEDCKMTTRKHTTWEDIGLTEYNSKTMTWECRIGDCDAKMETTKRISHHRRKHHPEHCFGPNKQDITSPYCSKTLSALNRLLIHIELSPREGHWNIDTCPQLQQDDDPRDKWAKILLRMKGS